MNLPDAPIAYEGFFATHFVIVSDQDKSKDFYVRILGGRYAGTSTQNDLLRAVVGVANLVSGPLLTRFSEDRPHEDPTDTIV